MKYILILCFFLLPGISFAEIDQSVPYTIATIARQYGMDPQQMLFLTYKESGWNCHLPGDHGKSFGCWQIHLPSHPEITREQAEDIVWSTHWSIQTMIHDGSCRQWSTCKLLGVDP